MYLVRVRFTNRYGSPFHWDFQVDTDDYAVAVDDAVLTFWAGLTRGEREDACETITVLAYPSRLPLGAV